VKPRVRETAVDVLYVKGNSVTQPFAALGTGREGWEVDPPSITSCGKEREREVAGFARAEGSP